MNSAVTDLVNTSCDDLKSSLNCSFLNGDLRYDVLHEALLVSIARNEKTKIKIIRYFLLKLAGSN